MQNLWNKISEAGAKFEERRKKQIEDDKKTGHSNLGNESKGLQSLANRIAEKRRLSDASKSR